MSEESNTAQILHAFEEIRATTQAKVVARIEQVLEQARRGEVCAVAISTVGPNLATGSCFTLGDKTLAELLGSMRLTEHRIMTQQEDGPLD